ncbi:hypothetical protein BJ742DRAFT_790621 [Cladochytrium replicatum]|nr:hypothetical protein BJ742DRAFT_790621 [Cladochytrium replicatum]
MSGGRRILDFPNIQTFYRGVTPAILKDEIILPGVDDLNNSKASCSDVNPFAKLSIVIESLDNDKAALSLSIPFTLDISQRRRVENGTLNIELEKFGKDSIAALGIAGLAVVFLVIWSTILWVSHKKRSVLYKGAKGQSDDSKKAIRKNATDVLEDTDADGATRVLLMSEDPTRSLVIPVAALGKLGEVSEGVKKHIDSFGVEKLCQGSDEFEIGQKISSTPSATRVQTLGKVGMSLYQLLPFRLATIGNATLVVGENGNLIKLPRLFNYISALWLPVLLLVIIFGIGVVVTDYIFIQTIDSNFGYFWLAGGVGLSGTLIYMQSTYKAPIKGMLRLFRSIAPPTCEEVSH